MRRSGPHEGRAQACVAVACLAVVLLLVPQPARGQLPAVPDSTRAPRVGVVLSGGGARGFAHIGALKVLDALGLPVDLVTGTSMGSIVGGLYAAGYRPDEIERIVVAQDWVSLFSQDVPRELRPLSRRAEADYNLVTLPLRGFRPFVPTGLTSGQQVDRLITRLTLPVAHIRSFSDLPISFAAVATDLFTGEAVRITEGSLSDAIRASIAIPGVLTPVELDGHTFIDGGVARNLPAEDAVALGADLTVCVQVGTRLEPGDEVETLGDILGQTLFLRGVRALEAQSPFCTVLIEPLEDLEPYTAASYEEAAAIIQVGADAARQHVPELQRLLRDLPRTAEPPPRAVPPDSVFITRLRFEGVDGSEARALQRSLQLDLPTWVQVRDLDRLADLIYSTQQYGEVTYRVDPVSETLADTSPPGPLGADDEARPGQSRTMPGQAGPGYELTLRLRGAREGYVGVGLRYEGKYKTSLLLSGLLINPLRRPGTVSAWMRIGQLSHVGAAYQRALSFQPYTQARLEVVGSSFPIDIYREGRPVNQFKTVLLGAEAQVGLTTRDAALLSLGVHTEVYDTPLSLGGDSLIFGPTDLSGVLDEGIFRWGPVAEISLDTFDDTFFPVAGHQVQARSRVDVLGGVSSTHHVDWQARWPLAPAWSLMTRLVAARSFGDVPLHQRFFLGGTFPYEMHEAVQVPFYGYSVQELAGANLRSAMVGLQWQLRRGVFVQARWNGAFIGDTWDWLPDLGALDRGFGVAVGLQTVLAPIEVALGMPDLSGPYALRVNFGPTF